MPDDTEAQVPITLEELIELCAVDTELFSRTFFPKTVRQESAPFHADLDRLLESPNRLINIQVFRGGAKTTKLRLFAAKQIAFGIARTILYIGKSESHALRSVKWLRRQVEYNKAFAQTFNLRPGKKWQDSEAEIWHGTDEHPVWIMAAGITGSIRGINQDDFRPDLIIIDDVIDEENSATPEQRQKIESLIYGALKESLAPESEAPRAKMVMLQTPLNKEDASTKALDDPEWASAVFSCWTPATCDLPLEKQESSWAARWSSETLRREKQAAIDRNQLSVWLREKECKIVSPETSAFKPDWLEFYDLEPERPHVIMVIDPVPPPSEIQISKGLRGKDFEAFAVIGTYQGYYYLLDYSMNRGHDPDWTMAEFFRLGLKWRPSRVLVEAVAYQRTLAWLLRKAMEHQSKWFVVQEYVDKRKKYDRIVDSLAPVASNHRLKVKHEHSDFISQFSAYPDVAHDDLIEAVAIGVADLSGFAWAGSDGEATSDVYDALMDEEKDVELLEDFGGGVP